MSKFKIGDQVSFENKNYTITSICSAEGGGCGFYHISDGSRSNDIYVAGTNLTLKKKSPSSSKIKENPEIGDLIKLKSSERDRYRTPEFVKIDAIRFIKNKATYFYACPENDDTFGGYRSDNLSGADIIKNPLLTNDKTLYQFEKSQIEEIIDDPFKNSPFIKKDIKLGDFVVKDKKVVRVDLLQIGTPNQEANIWYVDSIVGCCINPSRHNNFLYSSFYKRNVNYTFGKISEIAKFSHKDYFDIGDVHPVFGTLSTIEFLPENIYLHFGDKKIPVTDIPDLTLFQRKSKSNSISNKIDLLNHLNQAGKRIAVRKCSKTIHKILVTWIDQQFPNHNIKNLNLLFDSEIGRALGLWLVGILIAQKKDSALAEELRIEGLALGMQEVFDLAFQGLTPEMIMQLPITQEITVNQNEELHENFNLQLERHHS